MKISHLFPLLAAALLCAAPSLGQRSTAGARTLAGARTRSNRVGVGKNVSETITPVEGNIGVAGGSTSLSGAENSPVSESVLVHASPPVSETTSVSEGLGQGGTIAGGETTPVLEAVSNSASTVAKPNSAATVNGADELGDVAFSVTYREGSGNTVKEDVSGVACTSDANIGANWAQVDAGLPWSGLCLDNTASAGTSRAAVAFDYPAAVSASGHFLNSDYIGALTVAMLFQPYPSSIANQGLFNHLLDLSGNGGPIGGYENASSIGWIGSSLRDSSNNLVSGSSQIFQFNTTTAPWMALIWVWGAGTGGGVTLYNNLDGSGNRASGMVQVATFPTADLQNTLKPAASGAGRLNAAGPYGALNPPRGYRGKPYALGIWERGLVSQERNDWYTNPCRYLH